MRLLLIFHILAYSLWSVSSLRICSRRHFTIHHDAIFQRVELPSADKCVERCIESISYCKAVIFMRYSKRDLGLCIVHTVNSQINSTVFHPDASIDPDSTVYELLDKCSAFSVSDIAHRISPNHQKLLENGGKDLELLQQDAFFPERDRFSETEMKLGKRDRYATMKTIDFEEDPHNPFDSQPVDHPKPKSPFGDLSPIRPVQVLHQGRQMGAGAQSAPIDMSCRPGMPCAATLMTSHDSAPCPARRGDPCAPKPPCMEDECFHVDSAPQTVPVVWTEWSSCSVTCGSGMRTRQCMGGSSCYGSAVSPCTLSACSEWMPWGAWSLCSASCGMGEKKRTRLCAGLGGCAGPSAMVESCQSLPCPTWSEWGPWQGCNISCGRGKERRMRMCQNGIFCPGAGFEDRECDRGPCPHWADWSPWTSCSQSCNGGEMKRTRECVDGGSCAGSSEEKLLCNQQRCPDWTAWTEWTLCDQTKCDDESFRLRNRVCLYRGVPFAGCEGSAQDQIPCPVKECATWTDWKEWSDCSVTCGQGNQKRTRTCEGGNGNCEGSPSELRFCQLASCPYWGPWSSWGGCSVSCGLGVCERRRKCITDELLNIPSNFEELDQMPMEIMDESDKAKAALIARSKHIKMKQHNSTRMALADLHYVPPSALSLENAGTCLGNDVDRKTCDAGPCCMWDLWTEWSPCIGCGNNGISRRNRQCVVEGSNTGLRNPALAFQQDLSSQNRENYAVGAKTGMASLAGLRPIVPIIHRGKRATYDNSQCYCPGPAMETQTCPQAAPCAAPPAQCTWSSWGEWCGCTACRAGREIRRRYCDRSTSSSSMGPTIPDPSCRCSGPEEEQRQCKTDESCFSSRAFPTLASNAEGESSDSNDRYIPIDSRINAIEFNGQVSSPHNIRKDAIFSTTAFPYPVCRWSQWSEWSSCHSSGKKERNRFCINSDALVNNCECMGLSTESNTCDPREQELPSRENLVPGEEKPIHAETEFTTEEENELDTDLESVLRSTEDVEVRSSERTVLQNRLTSSQTSSEIMMQQPFDKPQPARETPCEWTRWSQWSECTTSCGPGEKVRKRRCPCGDGECGGGIETEMESCEKIACLAEKRRHPVFSMTQS